jgi:hypothetical protein
VQGRRRNHEDAQKEERNRHGTDRHEKAEPPQRCGDLGHDLLAVACCGFPEASSKAKSGKGLLPGSIGPSQRLCLPHVDLPFLGVS